MQKRAKPCNAQRPPNHPSGHNGSAAASWGPFARGLRSRAERCRASCKSVRAPRARVLVQTACAVVAGLLHFSFLAAFTWMCLEGLHLYVLLVRVFEPSWLRVWHALVSGYGLPALLVLCSAIAFPAGYGTMQ